MEATTSTYHPPVPDRFATSSSPARAPGPRSSVPGPSTALLRHCQGSASASLARDEGGASQVGPSDRTGASRGGPRQTRAPLHQEQPCQADPRQKRHCHVQPHQGHPCQAKNFILTRLGTGWAAETGGRKQRGRGGFEARKSGRRKEERLRNLGTSFEVRLGSSAQNDALRFASQTCFLRRATIEIIQASAKMQTVPARFKIESTYESAAGVF